MNERNYFSFALEKVQIYPTETVRCFLQSEPGMMRVNDYFRVEIPADFTVEGYLFQQGGEGANLLTIEQEGGNTLLIWRWEVEQITQREELVILFRAKPTAVNGFHTFQALLLDEHDEMVDSSWLRLKVKRMAESFRYLPEVYQRDDFTNRFLMLFESFWKPISRQIDHADCYYDPHLTPSSFLPWLAGWFGLELEGGLSENRQRDLISMIMPIYAQKGTRHSLKKVLSLYSGGEVQITEHFDNNLILGEGTHLGYQIALGNQNRPHSFDVFLSVPESYIAGDKDPEIRHEQYSRRISSLIEKYKPAHSVFHLEINFLQS